MILSPSDPARSIYFEKVKIQGVFSTASGALVVGGVRDICMSSIHPGDRFECSMEYNQSVSGSLW